jgi:hypothetical protein
MLESLSLYISFSYSDLWTSGGGHQEHIVFTVFHCGFTNLGDNHHSDFFIIIKIYFYCGTSMTILNSIYFFMLYFVYIFITCYLLNDRMLMASIFDPEFQGRNLRSCMVTPLWKSALLVALSKACFSYQPIVLLCVAFSLSLSLSLTHTHTHTLTHILF